MKTKRLFLTALTLAGFSVGAWAQTPAPAPSTSNESNGAAVAPAPPITAADVQALRDALAAQQKQIDRLTQILERQQGSQSAAAATGTTDAVQVQPVSQQQPAELKNAVIVQQDSPASSGLNIQDTQADTTPNPMHGPVSIHFKGITITPAGFVAAEFVRRSRALGADVTTPFNSLTLPGASQSTVPEFFGSARQSRPTVYIDGRMKNIGFSAYVSADFLSAGVTSSATQTNSYTLRLRQAWAQAKFDNGFSFLGGQMWSLLTEGKVGIAPSDDSGRTNDARPMTIDPQYNVGFTFARQYGLRVTKSLAGDKVWLAAAIENAEGTVTSHNNGDNFLLGETGASNSYNTTGTYTFNPSPDLIAKAALDPGFGHYEIFGVYDRFTDRIFPCGEVTTVVTGTTSTSSCNGITVASPNAVGAFNASKSGGGFGANARWYFDNKHVVFGVHGFGGDGVGRYGAAQLSDLSIHSNGTLNLIRGYQGLGSIEWHGKKLDLYAYAGGEYASRTADYDPITKKYVGYGSPFFSNYGCYTEAVPGTTTAGFTPGTLANCTGDTRMILEGTAGFWYRFYNGPRGKFQFGTQYSYVTRETWSGVGFAGAGHPGVTPSGLDNMVFTSFRYYLP
ncbi:MAG: hypothetical protein WB919_22580 [Candidatus Sulfotelmatobacter sp.]